MPDVQGIGRGDKGLRILAKRACQDAAAHRQGRKTNTYVQSGDSAVSGRQSRGAWQEDVLARVKIAQDRSMRMLKFAEEFIEAKALRVDFASMAQHEFLMLRDTTEYEAQIKWRD